MNIATVTRRTLSEIIDCYRRGLCFETALIKAGLKRGNHAAGVPGEDFTNLWEETYKLGWGEDRGRPAGR